MSYSRKELRKLVKGVIDILSIEDWKLSHHTLDIHGDYTFRGNAGGLRVTIVTWSYWPACEIIVHDAEELTSSKYGIGSYHATFFSTEYALACKLYKRHKQIRKLAQKADQEQVSDPARLENFKRKLSEEKEIRDKTAGRLSVTDCQADDQQGRLELAKDNESEQ